MNKDILFFLALIPIIGLYIIYSLITVFFLANNNLIGILMVSLPIFIERKLRSTLFGLIKEKYLQ